MMDRVADTLAVINPTATVERQTEPGGKLNPKFHSSFHPSLFVGRAFLAVEHLLLVSSSFLLDVECEQYQFASWVAPRGGASHGILLGVTMVPALAASLDPGPSSVTRTITTSPDHLRKLFISAFGLLALLALLGPKDRQGILKPR